MSGRKVPNTLEAFQDESLLGFLQRLTAHLRLTSPTDLVVAAGHSEKVTRDLPYQRQAALDVAEFARLTPATTHQMIYMTEDGQTLQFSGHPVSDEFILRQQRRVCPDCLKDAPYHRMKWDLAVYAVCEHHHTRMLDTCPSCSKRLTWTTGGPCSCSCGFNLQNGRMEKLEPERVNILRGFITAATAGPSSLSGLSREIGLSAWQKLCGQIGLIHIGKRSGRTIKQLALKDVDTLLRSLEVGASALDEWPDGFHRHLDQLRKSADDREGRYGYTKVFGVLPERLKMLRRRNPHADILYQELLRYLQKHPEIPTRSKAARKLRDEAETLDAVVTLSNAAATIGVSYSTLRRVGERHSLWFTAPEGQGSPCLFHASTVAELKRDYAGLLSRQDARALLGVSKPVFDGLEAKGLIPHPSSDVAAELFNYAVWKRDELEALLARFDACIGQKATSNALSLNKLAVSISTYGGNASDVLEACLKGELETAGWDRTKGLSGLKFDASSVAVIGKRLREQSGAAFSIAEAAKVIGVKDEVAYEWVRMGFLQTFNGSGAAAQRGRRVSKGSLEDFLQRYITARELREYGRFGTSKKLALDLIERGLKPVSGPSVDGGRQYLFRRKDAAHLR